MNKLPEIAKSIQADIPKILEEWRKLKQQEPWLSLPEEYQLDHLPEAITTLIDAALSRPDDREAQRAYLWAAATHGHDRFQQGFAEQLIFTEHHLLRRALRRYINHHHGDSLQCFEAIARIDAATTLSTVASFRGYHRAIFEQRGEWPQAIERLVNEGLAPRSLEREAGSSA